MFWMVKTYKIHLANNLLILSYHLSCFIIHNPTDKIRSVFTAVYWRKLNASLKCSV